MNKLKPLAGSNGSGLLIIEQCDPVFSGSPAFPLTGGHLPLCHDPAERLW